MSLTPINVRMVTSEHGLSHPFKGFGAVANDLTGIKHALVPLHFQLELNTTGFLSVATGKNLED